MEACTVDVVLTEHFRKILEEAQPQIVEVHVVGMRSFRATLTLLTAIRLAEEVQRREAWAREQRAWRKQRRAVR